jgi:hypothetical protein
MPSTDTIFFLLITTKYMVADRPLRSKRLLSPINAVLHTLPETRKKKKEFVPAIDKLKQKGCDDEEDWLNGN